MGRGNSLLRRAGRASTAVRPAASAAVLAAALAFVGLGLTSTAAAAGPRPDPGPPAAQPTPDPYPSTPSAADTTVGGTRPAGGYLRPATAAIAGVLHPAARPAQQGRGRASAARGRIAKRPAPTGRRSSPFAELARWPSAFRFFGSAAEVTPAGPTIPAWTALAVAAVVLASGALLTRVARDEQA